MRRVHSLALRLALIVICAVFALGDPPAQLWSLVAGDPPRHVTFNRDVAPIVYQYCSACHRPGEAGPFPLLTYQDVKKHGRQIAAVTQTRFMPPWLPDPGELKFADERRLSDRTDCHHQGLGRSRNVRRQAVRSPSEAEVCRRMATWAAGLDLEGREAIHVAGDRRRYLLELHSSRSHS